MKFFRYILVFTVGAGVGAFVADRLLNDKYKKLAEAEIDEVREYYKEQMRKVEDSAHNEIKNMLKQLGEDEEETSDVEDEDEIDEEAIKKDLKQKRVKHEKQYTDYTSMYKKNEEELDPAEEESPEEEEDEEEISEHESEVMQRIVTDMPYIITSDEFTNENLHYDKVTITYYSEDDVLADENEEIISDTDYLIGDDSLTSFGEGCDDPDIVYVRNERISTDYEIIRVYKSYSRDVLGIDDSDIKSPKSSPRKRRVIDEEI